MGHTIQWRSSDLQGLRVDLEIWTSGLSLQLPDLSVGILCGVIGHIWQQGRIIEGFSILAERGTFQLGGLAFLWPISIACTTIWGLCQIGHLLYWYYIAHNKRVRSFLVLLHIEYIVISLCWWILYKLVVLSDFKKEFGLGSLQWELVNGSIQQARAWDAITT